MARDIPSRHHLRWLIGSFIVLLATACSEASEQDHNEQTHKVIWQHVRDNGLVATYLRPKGDEKRAAVVVVGGSEGGIQSAEQLAYKFAERGWPAMAVAYFGMETLPGTLTNIPLEYFDSAITWLRQQPHVAANELAIVGVSRGAELALLVASRNSAINRVIAFSPSAVVWGPVDANSDRALAAWTVNGKALPYVPQAKAPNYAASPYRGTPDFLTDLTQTSFVEAATIPVEKIHGAILLLSGEDDQVWPAQAMSDKVMKRLQAACHPYRTEHVSFTGAGHLISPGPDPAMTQAKHPTGVVMAFGGNETANRRAQKAAWTTVMMFLRTDVQSQPDANCLPALEAVATQRVEHK